MLPYDIYSFKKGKGVLSPRGKNMKYSQNNEEQLISNYFGSNTGTLLSLGENDGRTLSNVYAAIQRGWGGVLVEPSITAFTKLQELYHDREDIQCFNVAIGEHDGEADFYESGEHLGNGDTSLISTLIPSEIDRWKGSKFDNFTQTKARVLTWPSFIGQFEVTKFDLISIDCEGLDYFILSQMDLTSLGCRMLIVEFNGKDADKYISHAAIHGMKEYARNGENLIFVR